MKPPKNPPHPDDDDDDDDVESASVLTLSPPGIIHVAPTSVAPMGDDFSPTSPLSSSTTTASTTPASSAALPASTKPTRHRRKPSMRLPPSHPLLDSQYNVGSKLGSGCFATVYKAVDRSNGEFVAIKAIERNHLDQETTTLLDNELDILRTVSKHPGIVTLQNHVDTESHMFFIMDYVDGGPLLDRVVKLGSFSENDTRILLRCILLTLEFLSKLGCVHRDIKPENILVDNYSNTWPIKLTDFGLSTKMQSPNHLLYDALGTPLFVAPEILKGDGYDCSCDMWSLGVVMYIVLCGYPPFPYYDTPSKLIHAIINCQYEFPKKEWDHVSNDAIDMIKRMLEVDPRKRITPQQALQHRWVSRTQSKLDLPNKKLNTFNAKRKLKALVVAVRTMNIVSRQIPKFSSSDNDNNSSNSTDDISNDDELGNSNLNGSGTEDSVRAGVLEKRKEEQQQQLMRDVEHNKAIIKKMGIGLDGKSIPSLKDRHGKSIDKEHLLSSRRSLVLPLNMLSNNNFSFSTCDDKQNKDGTLPDKNGNQGINDLWNDPTLFQSNQVIEIDANASQYMESRAKALMAEVHKSGLLVNETNPFMISEQTTDSGSSSSANNPKDGGRPAALASLDFGLLG